MKTKYIASALLILAFGGLIFYRIIKNKESNALPGGQPKGGAPPTTRVAGIVVKPQEFANRLLLSGSIEANEQVDIRSEVSGLVRGIFFDEGSTVKEGQVLLKIDDSELRAQLASAQTKQELASENERRAKLLLEKEAISQEEYDVARADLKSAQAQSQLIKAQIAKTSVKAPFSGKIGLRAISIGGYLSPQTVVANLVNTNPVKITFSIPEKYSSQVRINTVLQFTIAGSAKKYSATVYAIEPSIETSTRTLQLRAKAENSDGKLLPGSFVDITLPLELMPKAILIPTQAIIPIENGKKVFVSDNGMAKEIKVETSTRTASNVLVTSGLKAGDTVLTTGLLTLKPGSPVKVAISKY